MPNATITRLSHALPGYAATTPEASFQATSVSIANNTKHPTKNNRNLIGT